MKKIVAYIIKGIVLVVLTFITLSVSTVFFYKYVLPPVTPLMLTQAFVTEKGFSYDYETCDISAISPNLVQAVVASEDNLFLQHAGFDIKSIQQAQKEAARGKRVRGASTISQQCAKNVFLLPIHSYTRKVLEAYFTCLIETCWSKERIMEVYLNVIEYDAGVYGAEAAAQHYFHKSASRLTKQEAALLASALPSPRRFNPARPSSYLRNRAAQVRHLMTLIGPIDLNAKIPEKKKITLWETLLELFAIFTK